MSGRIALYGFVALVVAFIVLPIIAIYTVIAYTVFRGKATHLSYD